MSGFYSEGFRWLEIFLKSHQGEAGRLYLRKEGQDWLEYAAGGHQYRLTKIPLEEHTHYQLELSNCLASVAYLSGSANMLETGIRFLDFQNGECCQVKDLQRWYDTPNREQYHFNAFRNWINDPNGLCWYKGFYHLYYQANPHGQNWAHMYWGHGASKDLVHWIHLPYVLEPQEEILESDDKKGGAFSGCAVPLEDQIVFYFTRHIGPPEDTEEDTVQYQAMVTSADGIRFGQEVKIIEKPDESFSYNFRDPKVLWLEGAWQMVLGAKVNGIPSLVRYTSANMKDWTCQGILLEEREEGVYTFECPDFFPLNDTFVAVGSWMKYTDAQGRFQPTYYYLGDYRNGKFLVKSRGLYDFGGNFYAVQSFEHDGRRIAIAWTADCCEEHIPEEKGSCGGMTIPRELSVRDGRLIQRPAAEIYSLTGDTICNVSGQNLTLRNLNHNTYFARIDFRQDTDFDILLGESAQGRLRLLREKDRLCLKTEGVRSQKINYSAMVESIAKLEIFVDRRLVVVYVNDGELAGTKLFYQDEGSGVFHAAFQFQNHVEKIQIYEMKGIWR